MNKTIIQIIRNEKKEKETMELKKGRYGTRPRRNVSFLKTDPQK